MNDQTKESLLAQLRGVQLPEVSALPAPGWWILLATVCLCAVIGYAWLRQYRRQYWKRQAKAQLQLLRSQLHRRPARDTLADASQLARRVLLVARDRQAVAALHGRAWLQELDTLCARPVFAQGFGELLERGPYQRAPEVSAEDLDSLMDAMEELIDATHRKASER